MILTKQTVGIGILLGILATACSPRVQVKGNATIPATDTSKDLVAGAAGTTAKVAQGLNTAGDKTEDAASKSLIGANAEQRKAALDAGIKAQLKDLNLFIGKKQKELSADCTTRDTQMEQACDANKSCEVVLDITCRGRILNKEKTDATQAALHQEATALKAVPNAGIASGVVDAIANTVQVMEPDHSKVYEVKLPGSMDYAQGEFKWAFDKAETKQSSVEWKEVTAPAAQ